MCSELLRDYNLWLGELLEVLKLVCEDVVPAGRFAQDLYWRTRQLKEKLTEHGVEGGRSAQTALLLEYQRDGRALLKTVRERTRGIVEKNVLSGVEASGEVLPEEFRIHFRRTYGADILNSLQMLVNVHALAQEYLNCPTVAADRIFEVDTVDGMKRVRSGALVGGKTLGARMGSGQGSYGKPYIWKGYEAG